jgi:hypothetical protein
MASSEWEGSGTIVFTITGGPPADEFLVHGIAHLREIRCAPPFELVYGHGWKTAIALTRLGQRHRGRYAFRARATDRTEGPVPLLGEIEGFYDPSKRKGYFRVLPTEKDKKTLQEHQEEQRHWNQFAGDR